MDFLDSLKWVIFSQQLYRLAMFRTDKTRTRVITDNMELFLSLLIVGAIVAEVSYIGQKVYYNPEESFAQSQQGYLIFMTHSSKSFNTTRRRFNKKLYYLVYA